MKEKKNRVKASIPRRLYVEIHKRGLYGHMSFLASAALEAFLEFLKRTDPDASWKKLPTKLDQELYLERKLREFFSELKK
jgi:hypothetical protein